MYDYYIGDKYSNRPYSSITSFTYYLYLLFHL